MRLVLIFLMFFLPNSVLAEVSEPHCTSGEWSDVVCIDPLNFDVGVCDLIESQALVHRIPVPFFARLIWQESRFNPNAVSPAHAMGIAQFIRSTAKLRGLTDPFDPAEALEHSAELLSFLERQTGSLGLAAAAYNAGEGRVDQFLRQGKTLPGETRNYVRIITGLSADQWKNNPDADPDLRLNGDMPFQDACLKMARDRKYTKLYRPRPLPLWGVQLAYGSTKSKARAAYNRRARKCSQAIGDTFVHYLKVRTPTSGPRGFYVARLHATSRKNADNLCRMVARNGCPCRVYRNK